MDKEKEIEEMLNVLRYVLCDDTDYCDDCFYRGYGDCENRKIANRIYEAGYRKADEVRKETAKEIWKDFKLQRNHFDDWEWEVVKLICRTNGVEVDE